MNLEEVVGLFVILIIIAVGVSTGVHNLDVIARKLSSIHEEIQGIRDDLDRARHPKEYREPFV